MNLFHVECAAIAALIYFTACTVLIVRFKRDKNLSDLHEMPEAFIMWLGLFFTIPLFSDAHQVLGENLYSVMAIVLGVVAGFASVGWPLLVCRYRRRAQQGQLEGCK